MRLRILVTGFEGFDGRRENASWVAAESLVNYRGVHQVLVRQLPVLWGAPAILLACWIREFDPDLIVSFGEGNGFTLEALARNERLVRADNSGKLPPGTKICSTGPDVFRSTAPLNQLMGKLGSHFPLTVSHDAGQFLCEELLYTLEHFRFSATKKVACVFSHVPRYRMRLDNGMICNDATLAAYARTLTMASAAATSGKSHQVRTE